MGELSNKGGRGQRNREEIGAGASPLVLARFTRKFFVATPLLRPARQNRHATQATKTLIQSLCLRQKRSIKRDTELPVVINDFRYVSVLVDQPRVKTNLKKGAHIHQPKACSVPHACAQPYISGISPITVHVLTSLIVASISTTVALSSLK